MSQINKVSLIGLGAMGVFFAPRLSATLGSGFRIIADGARKERLEHKGVTVNEINYRFPIVTPAVSGDPADLIIISVKGYDLDQAINDIRNQVGPDTLILSVLNGVDSEEKVAGAYGSEHVLYSYMRMSIDMNDGKTEFDPEGGNIHFGDARNDPDDLSENVKSVAELFDRCGIPYKIDEDMIRGIWFKFMCNVGENMTCAMFKVPFGAFSKSDDANYFRLTAMREVIKIANAKGIDLGESDIARQEATIGRFPYNNRPSTLQDLDHGKRTEVDMFAGTVVSLGKELGIATPLCETFWHGIHLIEDKMFGVI